MSYAYEMGLRGGICNGCSLAQLKYELGKKFLMLPSGIYELDAQPVEGQGEPMSYKGRPIRFHMWGMSYGHSDECYNWKPPRKPTKKRADEIFFGFVTGKVAKVLAVVVFMLSIVTACYARTIDTIIIHHSASPDVSAATIDKWHKERGWSGIGYHFVIRVDGTIEKGRPLHIQGAHARGRNANSIGICLTGYDYFTGKQIKALSYLIEEICSEYPIHSIERHHKECPGPSLNVEAFSVYCTKRPIEGKASHFQDWNTASGKHIYPWTVACASWFYPLGSKLKVTNLNNGEYVIVEVIDRGPRKDLVEEGRIIDLTTAAFAKIGKINDGLVPVKVEVYNGYV